MMSPRTIIPIEKTTVEDKFFVSTVDLRAFGVGVETAVFRLDEKREPIYDEIIEKHCDGTVAQALKTHESLCVKYKQDAPSDIKSSGTRNAVTVLHIQPEELLRIAHEYERLKSGAAPGIEHVSKKLSDTVMLMAKTERVNAVDPYLQTK